MATPRLTLSGGVITDVTRLLAAEGDGRPQGSGLGVRRAATNLFRRGQCDSLTDWNFGTGAGITFTLDPTTPPPFSTQSVKVVCDGTIANQGNRPGTAAGLAAATGVLGVGSIYFKGVAGQSYSAFMRWLNTDASNTLGTTVTFSATGAWQLVVPPALAVDVAKTGDQLIIVIAINGTRTETFWTAHAMLEVGQASVSPYVATSGGVTATRTVGRIQAPATMLDPTTGWVAMRMRAGYTSGAASQEATVNPTLFAWSDGTANNLIRVGRIIDGWRARRSLGGTTTNVDISHAFSAGDIMTVVFAWTATQILVSANGAAFTAVGNTNVPTGLASLVDIGRDPLLAPVDCDILWFACGTGTLTNADVARIAAANFAGSPRNYFGANALLTGVFPAPGYTLLQPPISLA